MSANVAIRNLLLLILGPAVIAGVSLWVYLQGGRFVSTDNAYIKTDIVSVSSEITGRVVEVMAHDNDRVSKDQLLFRLDDQPYRIALAKAEANLANVHGSIESDKAEYLSAMLAIDNANTDLEFRRKEMERIRRLVATSAISTAQFDQAEYAWRSARNALDNRVQALQASRARLINPDLPAEQHPRYLQALAELEKARLDITHLEIRAPADGIAVNVAVHAGEYVIAGSALVSLVDDANMWLEANFKETDLTWVRPGQEVSVRIDAFPGQTWQAHVAGVMPATGSEFSLLPAQNSSGNWIKVVQRIRVNITLDNYNHDLPLSAGMSAVVDIDTGRSRTLPWIAAN
ncbi:HlyD family secretion protein [Pseudohongiella sp.]|uniref:Membrane fusion protein biotin-lipoyl like domain-containing protein n=1 Tax=marine sediment metagenome TaxID=412755 RepID=A0A0F9YFE9_9ZZZZ|nr:HlyD family secretion protein [Pseudohongiella sp.]HDZ08308.1 HlyD family secretion protein [Pseudohongiella sp.]HEA62584.1 HlyD family secretion protein [Pseudohongiella sp.]